MRLPCPDHARESRTDSIATNVAKTLMQIVVFWGFFLFLIPGAIVQFEDRLGIQRIDSQALRIAGVLLFSIMGCIGLYSGMIFAVLGRGTPLPLDTTTKLVIVGPYRYVRNPMAIAGISQGIAVGLYLGSPLTVAYATAGFFAWNILARPWEEEDLSRRFGEPYDRYRASVRCWTPRMRPYEKSLPET